MRKGMKVMQSAGGYFKIWLAKCGDEWFVLRDRKEYASGDYKKMFDLFCRLCLCNTRPY